METSDVTARVQVAPPPDADAERSTRSRPRQADVVRQGLVAAVLIAGAVGAALALRLAFVAPASFPLNDGGLFYAMARDVQASGFRLPVETSYNGGLPFAYPPLGVFLAAGIDRLGPWSLIDVMRFLPVSASVLSVGAFLLLAAELMRPRWLAGLAALWFALLPMGFVWVIMGGGVTRSIGQFCSLLAMWQAARLAREGRRSHVLGLGVWSGLTLLSHPEAAWFVAYSVPLFWIAYDRTRAGLARLVVAGALGLGLASPWVGLVLARHGDALLQPLADSGWPWYAGLVRLVHLDLTREASFPVLEALALFGALRALLRRDWFLPAWVLAAHLAQARAADQRAVVPLALLAAVGLRELAAFAVAAVGEQRLAVWRSARWATAPELMTAAAALPIALFSALMTHEAYRGLLSELPRPERDAMAVAAAITPPDAAFAVLTGEPWFGSDRTTEWFPALTGRVAVNVVQGYEWSGGFAKRRDQQESLQACILEGLACVESWAQAAGVSFQYLYVAKRPFVVGGALVDGTGALQAFVRSSPAYVVLYDGPGALIARRAAPLPPPP